MSEKPRPIHPGKPSVHIRGVKSPVEEYWDVHGDQPPYNDSHDDDGTYYDHPDSEHFDSHTDHEDDARYLDPLSLHANPLARFLERFEGVIDRLDSRFSQREVRLDTRFGLLAEEVVRRLDAFQKRLEMLEKRLKEK